jgi:hypothetical protein
MKVVAQGYAYVYQDRAVKLSMFVLGIYTVIASIHILHTVLTCSTSSSWDSASETVALALTSNLPRGSFRGTAAGISRTSTLKQGVRLEASQDHLQLSPGSERLPPNRRVQPNKLYG